MVVRLALDSLWNMANSNTLLRILSSVLEESRLSLWSIVLIPLCLYLVTIFVQKRREYLV